jgi:hypothetical protein
MQKNSANCDEISAKVDKCVAKQLITASVGAQTMNLRGPAQ